MGFFNFGTHIETKKVGGYTLDFLHRHQCAICPLNHQPELKHPHMEPVGAKNPVIYMLGEAPGRNEDEQGIPFVGEAGRLLRPKIPSKWRDKLRWSNCVRTRPPENRTPTQVEIEACRPSVEQDIERSKPQAIFGFGNVPLHWVLKQSGITRWCGRQIPVRIGSHTCWYFPMLHPATLLYQRFQEDRVSDAEFGFALDLKRAFAAVEAGLSEPDVHTEEQALADIELIYDADRVVEMLHTMRFETQVGIDLETNRLRPYGNEAKILSVALSSVNHTIAFPLHHPEATWTKTELAQIEEAISSFLHEATCRKISFGLSFELEWLAYFYGQEIVRIGKWECAQSQAYILDERQGVLSLDAICAQYFGFNLKAISNVDREQLESTPIKDVLSYNALDARYHRLAYLKQRPRLKQEGLFKVYQHQLRRVPTMVLTQLKGVPVDQATVNTLLDKYRAKLKVTEDKIAKLKIAAVFKKRYGHDYRASAPKDAELAFRKILEIEGEGADEEALSQIDHPLAKLTVAWRKANKVISTYLLPCSATSDSSVVHPDGLLHPVLSVHKTRTWRTSSEEPNSQNFPSRDPETKEVRSIVRPGGDLKVVSFDYAGIQARNIAMESLDPALIKVFWERYDIHSDWMERILKRYPQWVDGKELATNKDLRKEYRYKAKNGFVFPTFFGAAAPTVSRGLEIPEHIADRLIDDLFQMFPKIKEWQQGLRNSYQANGYVTGLSGFRRRAPVQYNELINAPIQADESIIVCDAMIRLSELDEPRYQAAMEIHDDLTFIWPQKDIERNSEVVIQHMLDVPFEWAHTVPIEVEMSVGDDWANKKAVGAFETTKDGLWREVK